MRVAPVRGALNQGDYGDGANSSSSLLFFIIITVFLLLSLIITVIDFAVISHEIKCRPHMTFAVDWALSNNYLSIYHEIKRLLSKWQLLDIV